MGASNKGAPMCDEQPISLIVSFQDLPDPRVEGRCDHNLIDIIVITVCAVIAGAESWVDVQSFGEAKQAWLKTFLALPAGIPSHDTFGRFFAVLDAEAFQIAFMRWVEGVFQVSKGQVIALDGKTVRRSHDRTITIAAAAIGQDEDIGGIRIVFSSGVVPPGHNRIHRKFRRISRLTDRDIPRVVKRIINPIGHRFAIRQTGKIVDVDRCGLFTPDLTGIAKGADEFFLFGVHTDHRLSHPGERLSLTLNVGELPISIRVRITFQPFDVALGPNAMVVQQPADRLATQVETQCG